ncbi:12770_t:CDS:2, partial [Funneliformis geosporum]
EEKDALLKRTQEIMENNDTYEIQQRIKIQQTKNRLKMYYEEMLEPWVVIEEFLPEEEN